MGGRGPGIGAVQLRIRTAAILVDAGDEEGIADAITRLIDDPGLAEGMAGAASSRLTEDFSVGAWVERHIGLYRSLTRN